jgi:aminopeptidase N
VRLALFGESGESLPLVTTDGRDLGGGKEGLFVLDRAAESLTFKDVDRRPVPSLLRDFSAPVRLDMDLSEDDVLALFRYDTDPFNRWQAAQTLATRTLLRATQAVREGREPSFDKHLPAALARLLQGSQDHAFVAQVMALPSESDIAREIGENIDPDAILKARRGLRGVIGAGIAETLREAYFALGSTAPYAPDAASAGRRSLRNASLDLIAAGSPEEGVRLATAQFDTADNMTDKLAALAVLAQIPGEARERALAGFAAAFADNPLVLDKWFALQAAIPEDGTLDRVRGLMQHPAFALSNPNRARSLVGTFAMANMSQFHRPDGAGHAFVADIVLMLDRTNPQVAARLLGAFRTWRSLEPGRRAKAEEALNQIASRQGLSRDVGDIVQRSLA